MKTKNLYDHWHEKNIGKKRLLFQRERVALDLIKEIVHEVIDVVDLGCGNGNFMNILKHRFFFLSVKGIDYSRKEVKEAKSRGLNVKYGNIEAGIRIPSNSVDLIYSGELIEHLYNPDIFLKESSRILKKGGYIIITTPNLCAWYNRVLLFFGIQPLFLEPSTESKFVGAGILKRFKKDSYPVGHIRIFTTRALKDMFIMNKLKVIKTKGAINDEGLPKGMWFIDRLFNLLPKMSSHIIIVGKKE